MLAERMTLGADPITLPARTATYLRTLLSGSTMQINKTDLDNVLSQRLAVLAQLTTSIVRTARRMA